VDYQRTLETQRLKLLRFLTGLLLVVRFVSIRPFSSDFADWIREVTLSALGRAELAVRYLVIAQAKLIAAHAGKEVDPEQLLDCAVIEFATNDESFLAVQTRLESLVALLADLPRHGLRLLRKIQRLIRRLLEPETSISVALFSKALFEWLVEDRIERPPDRDIHNLPRV